jgi:hypothetical protein
LCLTGAFPPAEPMGIDPQIPCRFGPAVAVLGYEAERLHA